MSYYRNHSTETNRKPKTTIDTTKLAHVERHEGKWVVMHGTTEIAVVASVAEAMQHMRSWNHSQQEEAK